MTDDIMSFAVARGYEPPKPSLRSTLSDEQVEQIRYARESGLSWVVIARYFKEKHGVDYGPEVYRRTYGD